MPRTQTRGTTDALRRPVGLDCLSDRELLERFVAHRDEDAFTALVRRHARLVQGTCQRVLHDRADAEDAFQATFLVLARKAGSLRWRHSVAPWLYAVAHRVALKARARRARRLRHEGRAAPPRDPSAADLAWQELRQALDEELHALPERYRSVVLLCCLEGLARDEAAGRLGCSTGAVKGRLERGREMLRVRLARRGLLPSSVLLGALLARDAPAVTDVLVDASVRTGLGQAAVPTPVMTLTKGALQAMLWSKVKLAAAVVLAAGLLGLGLGVTQHHARADRDPALAAGARGDEREKPRTEKGDRREGDREREREGDRDRKREEDRDRPREGDRREGERRRDREGNLAAEVQRLRAEVQSLQRRLRTVEAILRRANLLREREGDRRPEEGRRRDGDRPREGARKRDRDRPREGDRDRPREGARKRDGDRDRPREGARKRDGDQPREGDANRKRDRERERPREREDDRDD
jgi:RNA polymerase sigma factor (sigma-70 family)